MELKLARLAAQFPLTDAIDACGADPGASGRGQAAAALVL
jgi:hypothetical protein